MEKPKLQLTEKIIDVTFKNGQSFELTPQESWQLTEELHHFLVKNHANFKPKIIKSVQVNGKEFNVVVSHNSAFWNKIEKKRWEPNTFKVFDHFISKDSVFFDIGAWIGPTALYGTQLAKLSFAFEPDPIAFKELALNVQANKNNERISRLSIYNKAIASIDGKIMLGNRGEGGDSMSSALFSDENVKWKVEAVTLKQFIVTKNIQKEKIFIKMDIEGGEYDLIPSLVSIHKSSFLRHF